MTEMSDFKRGRFEKEGLSKRDICISEVTPPLNKQTNKKKTNKKDEKNNNQMRKVPVSNDFISLKLKKQQQ